MFARENPDISGNSALSNLLAGIRGILGMREIGMAGMREIGMAGMRGITGMAWHSAGWDNRDGVAFRGLG
jgi:hypothetical protein